MSARTAPVKKSAETLLYGGATREIAVMTLDSGARLDLLTPDPAVLDLAEIGFALARICRFNGRTDRHYSLAEHSMLVAENLPREIRLYGLLHDAHEALIGDVIAPVRAALAALGAGEAFGEIETRMAQAVHLRAGLEFPPPREVSAAVDNADRRALATERLQILAEPARRGWGEDLPPPFPVTLRGLSWTRAGERFLERLRAYGARP